MTTEVPEGFRPLRIGDGFIGHNGPYYRRKNEDGSQEFGFRADTRHGNPNGVVHGGAILGFLDTVLGNVVVRETRRACATIALDSRFIAAAPNGAWITGRVNVKRITRSLAFVDAEAFAGDALVVTASVASRLD